MSPFDLTRRISPWSAAVALMLWLYWTAFAILVGAQFNAETMKTEDAATPTHEGPKTTPATAA